MPDNSHRDAAAAMNRTINDMMDRPILPLPSETYIEGSAVWEDLDRQAEAQEATSLDPADNGTPVEGVRDEGEQASTAGDDVVTAQVEPGEAMAADEIYAASFQSEDGDQQDG